MSLRSASLTTDGLAEAVAKEEIPMSAFFDCQSRLQKTMLQIVTPPVIPSSFPDVTTSIPSDVTMSLSEGFGSFGKKSEEISKEHPMFLSEEKLISGRISDDGNLFDYWRSDGLFSSKMLIFRHEIV